MECDKKIFKYKDSILIYSIMYMHVYSSLNPGFTFIYISSNFIGLQQLDNNLLSIVFLDFPSYVFFLNPAIDKIW